MSTIPRPFTPLTRDRRPEPKTAYDRVLHAFLDDWFVADPVFATDVGFHTYDDRWPDMGGTGRLARIALLRRHRAAAESLSEDDLSPDERVDRSILLEAIDAALFEDEVLRQETWDPLRYVYLLGSGLFALLARDYAPFRHRGDAFLGRMAGIPAVLAAARGNLLGMPDRPVSLLHTETALEQLAGIGELIDEAIAMAEMERARDRDIDHHRTIPEAAPPVRAALDEFRTFLDRDVRARAKGEGRLGSELFGAKLRHTLSSERPAADILASARRDFERVRDEMVRLARELWPTWLPDEPLPEGEGEAVENEIVQRVLDAVAREHQTPESLLDYCQREVARIEGFVRRNQMVGLPREPLRITWTPIFMRAYGGAFLSPPGPLDAAQPSHFWVTPPGDDWPPERTESYLREDNDRMLRLLCIHEAVPGHYLQLSWSNRCPSLTRAVFRDGMFAEGWAVYVTQVMMDVGYGRRDPALMLFHWKFYLRAVANAILDVLTHTAELSEHEAMDLMVRRSFQEEQEARAKWLRARLTSTQLCTYYLGSLEFWELEVAVRRRAALATGASAESVPEQRVVGGLGDTPGFDYTEHLEAVLSHGTPPIKWARRIVLGD
ncbi:MAG TPA: DUF885 domain-containing protein [Candidatus Limnocylindrales bacterium]|nr:DUF885 domain-containing protein [Candidatus Limnocylindrales bacterium]